MKWITFPSAKQAPLVRMWLAILLNVQESIGNHIVAVHSEVGDIPHFVWFGAYGPHFGLKSYKNDVLENHYFWKLWIKGLICYDGLEILYDRSYSDLSIAYFFMTDEALGGSCKAGQGHMVGRMAWLRWSTALYVRLMIWTFMFKWR